MNAKSEKLYLKLIPLMLAFFAMGFVDIVGTATNAVQADFGLSDQLAGILPSMVFLWFLIFSVPTGLLMNRIGRRKTVVLSLAVTSVSLLLPILGYSFGIMMVTFCLLGIGNTLLQVSLNPLVSNLVSKEKLASNLTLGQFVKAIASFIAPYIATWGARYLGDWKLLFPIFMAISILATLLLWGTKIRESDEEEKTSSFADCFRLLGNGAILLFFIGIFCHVGVDVGINLTSPRLIMESTGLPLEDSNYATSLYFLFRTIGCLAGVFILARFSPKIFFTISVGLMILGVAGLFISSEIAVIHVCIALLGLGNSNIFPVIISNAMLYKPDKKNEISGLMIMGLIGGAVFPLIMGALSDSMQSQAGALIVIGIGILYLLLLAFKMKK